MGRPARIWLEGADGGEPFVLSGEGLGNLNVELDDSPSDFYYTPVETIYTEHAFERGSTYNGLRIKSMTPVFTVNIFGTPQMPWELADDLWSTAWDFTRDSTLWYETPEKTSLRSLTLRLKQEPTFKPVKDPHLRQHARITMTTIAPDPFWYEPSVIDKWRSPIDTSGVDGNGDPIVAYGTVTVSNPTPYPIWPIWQAQAAPFAGTVWTLPDFSWGNTIYRRAAEDAHRVVVMPPLLANEHVNIDTDENAKREQVRSPLDTQIYLRMAGKRFSYPLRPRLDPVEVPVAVTGAPAGVTVEVRCPRPWPKPWGMRR
ncbi:phage tail protein [Rhodococcus aetherivorans]|uniref:phage tail protein n=1 Tax=Rhodococcus aetherivorans TaxID=191292 RepID=UPI00388FA8F9